MKIRIEISWLPLRNLTNSFIPHCSSSRSCINEYLAVDRGGYLCANTFRTLIAAWLNVFGDVAIAFDLTGLPIKVFTLITRIPVTQWSSGRLDTPCSRQVSDSHQAVLISGRDEDQLTNWDNVAAAAAPHGGTRGSRGRPAARPRRLATACLSYVIGGLLSPLKRRVKRNP